MTELSEDSRFRRAVDLFNNADWYLAHDAFEELWHELAPPDRITIQGLLQIAVGELHLQRGNLRGSVILLGEGLGRLRSVGISDLGIDLDRLCSSVQERLEQLQKGLNPDIGTVPLIQKKD